MKRLTRIVLILVLFSAAASGRVAAQEVVQQATQLETGLARGDRAALFKGRFLADELVPVASWAPAAAITIQRDGRSETLRGLVVERVYVAPDDVGTPVRRRTLLLWRDDKAFRVVGRTENGAAPLGTFGDVDPHQDALHPISVLMLPRLDKQQPASVRASEDAWWARAGELEIVPSAGDSACPGALDGRRFEGVACRVARYEVRLRAELEHAGGTLESRRLGAPARQQLLLRHASLPGVRIIVRCGTSAEDDSTPCAPHPEAFWRNDAQYAPELGVRVADFGSDDGNAPYHRVVRPGDPTFADEGRGVLRFTAWTPDGRVVVRDSAALPLQGRQRAKAKWISLTGLDDVYDRRPMHPGEVRQLLLAQRELVPAASPYAIAVARIEWAKLP